MLTIKDKLELRQLSTKSLETIVPLFTKMASHLFHITDKPGRLEAVAKEASVILQERDL